jgi:hypothetical protein
MLDDIALGETPLYTRKRPPDYRVERMRLARRISLPTVRRGSPSLLGLTAAARSHPQGGCAENQFALNLTAGHRAIPANRWASTLGFE